MLFSIQYLFDLGAVAAVSLLPELSLLPSEAAVHLMSVAMAECPVDSSKARPAAISSEVLRNEQCLFLRSIAIIR